MDYRHDMQARPTIAALLQQMIYWLQALWLAVRSYREILLAEIVLLLQSVYVWGVPLILDAATFERSPTYRFLDVLVSILFPGHAEHAVGVFFCVLALVYLLATRFRWLYARCVIAFIWSVFFFFIGTALRTGNPGTTFERSAWVLSALALWLLSVLVRESIRYAKRSHAPTSAD